ncbi:MAG: biopolymer transporter ExbD [Longimicrobiales bacterium]|nr:biopolymer transporter ExbD [Longimicrobiales bacterium]
MSSLGRRRRGASATRSDLPLNAEINVTSLVDVAFTLLIIFIITAPILQGGIEVAVPRADVQPLTAQEQPIFVTVQRDGTVLLEESAIPEEELESALRQIVAAGNIERVFLRADSLAPYGPVLRAMAAAVNSGVGWSAVAVPWTEN